MKTICTVLIASVVLVGSAKAQTAGSIEAVEEAFAFEPSVREVTQRALRYFRIDPESFDRLRRTSRSRALLPLFAAGYRYDDDAFARTEAQAPMPLNVAESTNQLTHSVNVGALWDLRQLAFNPAEVQVYGLVGVQRDILLEVTRTYFLRRQLQMRMALRPPDELLARAALSAHVAVRVLVHGDEAWRSARAALGAVTGVRLVDAPYGDIWLRDTAPLFRRGPTTGLDAVAFRFDGWGGKYRLEGDLEVAEAVARDEGVELERLDLVGEGGAVEVDGEGTCLTTRSCLLASARNPGASEAEVTATLERALGVTRVVWLERGLANDHTDGHVDTLARFVAPGRVAVMTPTGDDPNAEVLAELRRDLVAARDARGRPFELVDVPSPGAVLDAAGALQPASHLNFLVTNAIVVVPTYGTPSSDAAVEALAACFPDRHTVGLPARAILAGGGAFHCITQEVPER